MILKLFMKLLKAKLDAEIARQTPVGGTVNVKGVAHGIKIEGMEFELDCILRRTK